MSSRNFVSLNDVQILNGTFPFVAPLQNNSFRAKIQLKEYVSETFEFRTLSMLGSDYFAKFQSVTEFLT